MIDSIYDLRRELEKLRGQKRQEGMNAAMSTGDTAERDRQWALANGIDVALQLINELIDRQELEALKAKI